VVPGTPRSGPDEFPLRAPGDSEARSREDIPAARRMCGVSKARTTLDPEGGGACLKGAGPGAV